MTSIGYVVICKFCKRPVDPNKLEEHILAHQPSEFFDTVPLIEKWKTQKHKKKAK